MTRLIILNNHVDIASTGSEAYSELCQTSKMELFGKIVQIFQASSIFAKSFILDVWHDSEKASGPVKRYALSGQNSVSWI